MRVYIHILALLSALVIALPTASGDGRGATIWSEKNIQGRSTAIPANNYCTDMNNIFGDWDGKIRSIRVEAGYSCQFFQGYECGGGVLEFGRPDVILVMDDLGPLFDLNIHSARCNPITKEVAAGAEIAAGKAAITGTTALTVAIAVSIFTDTNMGGTNLSLPNDEFCYNLNYPGGAFPDFSDKARSLIVYKDNACEFFTDYACPGNGSKVEYGRHELEFNALALSGEFDRHIRSVKCRFLGLGEVFDAE